MTASGVRVRLALEADAPALAGIGRESFVSAYGGTTDASSIADHVEAVFGESAIRAEMQRGDREYLLAILGETPAGLAKLRWSPPPEAVTAPRPLELQQLYVHSGHQRAGAGWALLDATVIRAREKGFETLWLQVWSEADWAFRFYRRYGFERVGELPFYLGERRYDDWLMSLAL